MPELSGPFAAGNTDNLGTILNAKEKQNTRSLMLWGRKGHGECKRGMWGCDGDRGLDFTSRVALEEVAPSRCKWRKKSMG